jgi:flagellar hook assembly protein FlgD
LNGPLLLLGRRVRKLVDAELPAGFHTINWDGADDEGAAMASGVYIYRLSMGTQAAVKRMVLIS